MWFARKASIWLIARGRPLDAHVEHLLQPLGGLVGAGVGRARAPVVLGEGVDVVRDRQVRVGLEVLVGETVVEGEAVRLVDRVICQ